jgi:hypothetical protein
VNLRASALLALPDPGATARPNPLVCLGSRSLPFVRDRPDWTAGRESGSRPRLADSSIAR